MKALPVLFFSLSVRHFRICWVVLFWGFCTLSACANSADALALQQRLIEIFDQNKDAVVRVKAAYRKPDTDERESQITLRVGTGFFVSKEGHVMVSASRAAGADRVWIEFKGKLYATEAVGHDRLTNISILQVVKLPEEFAIIPVDASVRPPVLGSVTVAISCPLDLGPSPSMGMVTGIDKKLGKKVFPTAYIRTSLDVSAGRGGCPVLDMNGRLIGMAVASIPDLGGSYCLPSDALARIRDDLLFSGHIIHSWIGFEVASKLNNDNTNIVYLSKLIEGAPALEAGLKEGDHLLSIGDRIIENVVDVPTAVFFTRANQYTSVKILRGVEKMEFSVKTLPWPQKPLKVGTDRSFSD